MAGQADNTDILAGLNQVIVAINDKIMGSSGACGCGPTENPVFNPEAAEGQPPAGGGPGGGGVPPGYSGSEAEYSIYKCKAANYIFDDAYNALVFIGSMGTIAGGITAGTLFGTWLLGQLALAGFGTVGAGGVILFASVAAWEIAAIVALIAVVTLIAGSGVVAVFSAMATDFLTKKNDVICEMYISQNVSDAQDVLTDALGDSVLTFTISPPYDTWEATIRTMMSDIIDYFAPTTTFNKLFEEDEDVENYTAGTVDCTSCAGCSDFFIYGSGNLDGGTITSEFAVSYHRIQFRLSVAVDITLSSLSGWTGTVSPLDDFRASTVVCVAVDPPGTYNLYKSDANPFSPDWDLDPLGQLIILSNTPFTLFLTRN